MWSSMHLRVTWGVADVASGGSGHSDRCQHICR